MPRSPLWFRIVEYVLIVDVGLAPVTYLFLDKRRLYESHPLLKVVTFRLQLLICFVVAVGLLCCDVLGKCGCGNSVGIEKASLFLLERGSLIRMQGEDRLDDIHLTSDGVVPILPCGRAVFLRGARCQRRAVYATQECDVQRNRLIPA